MEAPIVDRRVFFPAVRTHRESRHSRLAPVIRQVTNDGKAWSAMCAIDERVLQAVGLHLPVAQAFGTNGDIGRDLCHLVRFRATGGDAEVGVWILCLCPFRNDYPVDGGHRWVLTADTLNKEFALSGWKDGADADPVIPVVHLSANPHFVGNAVDKRTEAHSLY